MEIIGLLIEKYEDEHVPELDSAVLRVRTDRRWANELGARFPALVPNLRLGTH